MRMYPLLPQGWWGRSLQHLPQARSTGVMGWRGQRGRGNPPPSAQPSQRVERQFQQRQHQRQQQDQQQLRSSCAQRSVNLRANRPLQHQHPLG